MVLGTTRGCISFCAANKVPVHFYWAGDYEKAIFQVEFPMISVWRDRFILPSHYEVVGTIIDDFKRI